jgi:type VI secretion system lysozyme-like protein
VRPGFSPTPLLDRLVARPDPAGGAPEQGARALDPAATLASVRREIDDLLNTRQPLAVERSDRLGPSTLTYGLPDLGWFSLKADPMRAELAARITATVEAFEPRLREVRVSLGASDDPERLPLTLEGRLVAGAEPEPVSFAVLIHRHPA